MIYLLINSKNIRLSMMTNSVLSSSSKVVTTSTALILESSKGNNVDHKTDAKTVVIDYQNLLIKEREDFFMKSPKSIPSAPISGLSSAKKGVWGKRGGGNNGSGSNGNESRGGTNEF